MQKKWFKAKEYGYGWYPASFEGWVVMITYLLIIVLPIIVLQLSLTLTGTIIYSVYVVFWTIVLIVIAFLTGEKAEWRWGNNKTKK